MCDAHTSARHSVPFMCAPDTIRHSVPFMCVADTIRQTQRSVYVCCRHHPPDTVVRLCVTHKRNSCVWRMVSLTHINVPVSGGCVTLTPSARHSVPFMCAPDTIRQTQCSVYVCPHHPPTQLCLAFMCVSDTSAINVPFMCDADTIGDTVSGVYVCRCTTHRHSVRLCVSADTIRRHSVPFMCVTVTHKRQTQCVRLCVSHHPPDTAVPFMVSVTPSHIKTEPFMCDGDTIRHTA